MVGRRHRPTARAACTRQFARQAIRGRREARDRRSGEGLRPVPWAPAPSAAAPGSARPWRRLALAEDDPVDRLIAEEAVDPLDDQRASDAASAAHARPRPAGSATPPDLLAGGEADRFGRRDLGVALADDLAPAADDRALDEAEALERHSADVADELAGRARTAAARRIRRALPVDAWASPSRADHAIAAPCAPMPQTACSNIMWITPGACRGARCRANRRPTPIACG